MYHKHKNYFWERSNSKFRKLSVPQTYTLCRNWYFLKWIQIIGYYEKHRILDITSIYVRGLAEILWSNTSGYIVGTYIISD